MTRAGLLGNALLFQLGWFACVLGAADNRPLAGVLVVGGIALLALRQSSDPRRHALLLIAAAAAGLLCDSLLVHFGWLEFGAHAGAAAGPVGADAAGDALVATAGTAAGTAAGIAAGIAAGHAADAAGHGLSPAWMVALWVNFACTLHASLRWLLGRPLLAALLGALGGPLSYAAGARLGALSLGGDATGSLVAVAIEWAVALPLLTLLAARVLPRAGAAPDVGS